jgi:hypothetical protein
LHGKGPRKPSGLGWKRPEAAAAAAATPRRRRRPEADDAVDAAASSPPRKLTPRRCHQRPPLAAPLLRQSGILCKQHLTASGDPLAAPLLRQFLRIAVSAATYQNSQTNFWRQNMRKEGAIPSCTVLLHFTVSLNPFCEPCLLYSVSLLAVPTSDVSVLLLYLQQ